MYLVCFMLCCNASYAAAAMFCLSDIVDSFYSVSIMCCLVLLSALCLSDMVDSFYSVSIMCCLVLLSAL